MSNRGKTLVHSLKPEEWLLCDQLAWTEVRRAHGRLTLGGSAAHLSMTTQDDLASRYGLFLDHIRRVSGQLDATKGPAAYVTVSTYTPILPNSESAFPPFPYMVQSQN